MLDGSRQELARIRDHDPTADMTEAFARLRQLRTRLKGPGPWENPIVERLGDELINRFAQLDFADLDPFAVKVPEGDPFLPSGPPRRVLEGIDDW